MQIMNKQAKKPIKQTRQHDSYFAVQTDPGGQ